MTELLSPARSRVAGLPVRDPGSARLRIAAIGGGTGLPVLLRGLTRTGNLDISAIVAVSDDGGSSGRLRSSMGLPAVGDLRNCLAALSTGSSPLAGLLQHRFSSGSLDGHALGNLFLAALHQQTGSLTQSSETAGRMLRLRGRALPVTEAAVTLCASFADGAIIRGEFEIPEVRKRIEKVWLEPEGPPPAPGVLDAIHQADAVVLAPGSLYTSLVPNLLVEGVAAAIRQSRAIKILVCNLMTQPGETDGFSASDHLRVVETWLGSGVVDYCVVHAAVVKPVARLESLRYPETGSQMVVCDSQTIRSMGSIPVAANLAQKKGAEIRHHPSRLARLVVSIARAKLPRRVSVEERKCRSWSQKNVSIDTRQIHEVGGGIRVMPAVRKQPCTGAEQH